MACSESNLWLDAMKVEMHSMYVNKVWKLVDLPEGIKPVWCKWIYKKKIGPDENVETFILSIVPTRRVVVSIYVHLMSYSLTKTLACSCLFINKS